MNKEEIYELMDRFESGSLYSMKLECEDFSLELQKAPPAPVMAPPLPAPLWPGGPVSAAAPAPADTPAADEDGKAEPESDVIVSPLAGTFYTSPEPGAEPYVTPGSRVEAGRTLCLVEAMKTMNEITAPCDCLILEILAEDASVVSYGEALIRYTKA